MAFDTPNVAIFVKSEGQISEFDVDFVCHEVAISGTDVNNVAPSVYPSPTQIMLDITGQMWEDVYPTLLSDLTNEGCRYESRTDDMIETIGSHFSINQPRSRCLMNSVRDFNIFQGIGQWLWILAGRMDHTFISFYSDEAERFTTDGFRLHGAYGPRISGIGVYNQIEQIIDTIEQKTNTRRALVPVFVPSLDNYPSRLETEHKDEVPCPVAFHFLPRGDELHFITYMRSQNAYKLLPLDVFIFTLIQDYVAARTGLEMGDYYHYSGSLHYNTKDEEKLQHTVRNAGDDEKYVMAPIPKNSAEEYLRETFQFEEWVRTQVYDATTRDGKFPVQDFQNHLRGFPQFWKDLNMSLLFWAELRFQESTSEPDSSTLWEINSELDAPFDVFAERRIRTVEEAQ